MKKKFSRRTFAKIAGAATLASATQLPSVAANAVIPQATAPQNLPNRGFPPGVKPTARFQAAGPDSRTALEVGGRRFAQSMEIAACHIHVAGVDCRFGLTGSTSHGKARPG